ncbi:enoyl-CoA delta isomerase 3, peroxisomal [Colias croceus]|uniref:enoyl-CoA delta isomerase 3, peroxisomal n=1 Tax=Colias crocea TaxID=72248 RepID=UPI001E27C4AE|nr:enoyl-CoA delta isomerase 3, peroxisomal [Colias croceus]
MIRIQVRDESNVRIIQFNKPKKKNAIDYNMYVEITKLINNAATDDYISIVVLTGTGDFYCSGNDLNNDPGNTDALLKAIEQFIESIILFPKLLIAIVNGPAVGIAVTTLPLCDFVYASEDAFFYTPFSRLELVSEACSSITFPSLLGERMARQMLMLNYKMTAREALQYGLISNVYKKQELQNKSWKNIKELLKLSQHSLITTKRLMREPNIKKLIEINKLEIEELRNIGKRVYGKSKL